MTFIINLTFTKCQMVIRPGTRKFSIFFFPYTPSRGNYYAYNISSYVYNFREFPHDIEPIDSSAGSNDKSDRMINRQLRDRGVVFYAENNNRKGTIDRLFFSSWKSKLATTFPIHGISRISNIENHIAIIIIIIIVVVVVVNRKTRGGKDKMEGKDEGV